jgi:hypothetical protein
LLIRRDENAKSTICILLLKSSGTPKKSLDERILSVRKFQRDYNPKIAKAISKGQDMWSNYKYIRFGILDLDSQPKFKKLMTQLQTKNSHEVPIAIGIIYENKKYFLAGPSGLIYYLHNISRGFKYLLYQDRSC